MVLYKVTLYMQNQKENKLKIYIFFKKDLKTCSDVVSLHSVERLFHTLAPLYEKLFCPTVDFSKEALNQL